MLQCLKVARSLEKVDIVSAESEKTHCLPRWSIHNIDVMCNTNQIDYIA